MIHSSPIFGNSSKKFDFAPLLVYFYNVFRMITGSAGVQPETIGKPHEQMDLSRERGMRRLPAFSFHINTAFVP